VQKPFNKILALERNGAHLCGRNTRSLFMSASPNRFFDDMSRLFNDAAGAARSLGREAEAAIKTQVERLLANMDIVNREEFEAVRDMAVAARNANDALERRIAELEAKIAELEKKG
jgi:BMFP domain-containing protein YqiC